MSSDEGKSESSMNDKYMRVCYSSFRTVWHFLKLCLPIPPKMSLKIRKILLYTFSVQNGTQLNKKCDAWNLILKMKITGMFYK